MPEPISAIVALHNLTTKLVESIQDRRFAAEMRDIQRLVVTQQAEHIALQEKNLQLAAENAELKKKVSSLEQHAADANRRGAVASDEERFHRGTKFKRNTKTGWVWMAFCPICDLPAKESLPQFGMICARAPKCLWKSEFVASEKDVVLRELPTERTA